jgi:tRNA G10  N-methylase Trm11
MKYAFILGREAALSTTEILSRLTAEGFEYNRDKCLYSREALIVETDKAIDVDFFHGLGGCIKFGEVIKEMESLKKDAHIFLKGLERESLDFGISWYGTQGDKTLGLDIKKALRAEGLSVRVVAPQQGVALTSVQVDKNKLITKGAELLVIRAEGKNFLAKTLAVQAFESFGSRDFGRPGRDSVSGMLPPKLARMMINLAGSPTEDLLVDPFCGSGTVLTEAVLMGHRHLLGTDNSERAISDTKKNYTWTIDKADIRGVRFNALKKDVRELSGKIERGTVSAIVTEPYLGPPQTGRESDQIIHKIFLELMDLYLGAFEAFSRVVKPGGVVVFAFPIFGEHKHMNLHSKLRDLGFKAEGLLPAKAVEILGAQSATGMIYRRPEQKVGREIFRFRFTPVSRHED